MDNTRSREVVFFAIFLFWVCTLYRVDANCKNRGVCKRLFTAGFLKKRLTPLQYRVTQEGATEEAFSGVYVSKKKNGKYKCVVCTNEVFSTEQQFQSGRGYAAFKTALKNAIELDPKVVNGETKTEASCGDCGAHLGQRKKDGSFDINSAALTFQEAKARKKALKKAAKRRVA